MKNIVSESVPVVPVKRKDGTYALMLCLQQGHLTPGMLKRVLEVSAEYGLPGLRGTTGQRMKLESVPADLLDEVVEKLGCRLDAAPPSVTVCPGGGVCTYGVQPTRELGAALLALVKKNAPYPYKIKTGVSGCRMGCAHSFVRDLGIVGGAKGWEVWYGGGAGKNASVGVRLGAGLTGDEALALVEKALVFSRDNGRKRERTSGTLRRLGEQAVLDALG